MAEYANNIDIAIADDHPAFRMGLAALLSAEAGVTIVGVAANGLEAVELWRLRKPHVLRMDVDMPEMDGIAATRAIVGVKMPTRVVAFSSYTEDDVCWRAWHAGASWVLAKTASVSDMTDAIRRVARGERVRGHQAPTGPKRFPAVDVL